MSDGRKTGLAVMMIILGAMLFWSSLPAPSSAYVTIAGTLTRLNIQIDPKYSSKDAIYFKLEGQRPEFNIGPLDIHNSLDIEDFKNNVEVGKRVEIKVLEQKLNNNKVSVSSFSMNGKPYIDPQRSRDAHMQNLWIGLTMIIIGVTLFVMMMFRGIFGEEHVLSQAFTAYGIGGTAFLLSTFYGYAFYQENVWVPLICGTLDLLLIYWIISQSMKLKKYLVETRAEADSKRFLFKKTKQDQKNVS